jgi:type IV secretion system protein VirD4
MSGESGFGPRALVLGRAEQPGADGPAEDGAGFITTDEDSHVLTIAPTRSGRARHCLIPNLLTYPGGIVALDLDGEAYAATAEARRRLGHTVVRLDPFAVTGPDSAALDPIDLVTSVVEPGLTRQCQDLAALLPSRAFTGDPLAYETHELISALIAYLAVVPEKFTFDELHPTLHTEDLIYSLAVVLDTVGKRLPPTAFTQIASFLDKDDRTRARIVSRARVQAAPLGRPEVRRTLRNSTITPSRLAAGDPITVYLVVPAERLATDGALLRLWVGTLMYAVSNARRESVLPVLFLLDHCAELGSFPLIESALRRGTTGAYRIWTFWHDFHQLRVAYPGCWPEVVSGSGAVQVFGTTDTAAAAEAEDLLGLPSNEVWSLGAAQQIIRIGASASRARKIEAREGVLIPAA